MDRLSKDAQAEVHTYLPVVTEVTKALATYRWVPSSDDERDGHEEAVLSAENVAAAQAVVAKALARLETLLGG